MGTLLAILLAIVALAGMVGLISGGKSPRSPGTRDQRRTRLTDQQILVLTAADTSRPIYAENPSLMHAQMPNGAACFNLRTVQSLVKRGFLQSDGKGGYLITPEGQHGLRSGMGF
jgi:hypothetical protein